MTLSAVLDVTLTFLKEIAPTTPRKALSWGLAFGIPYACKRLPETIDSASNLVEKVVSQGYEFHASGERGVDFGKRPDAAQES